MEAPEMVLPGEVNIISYWVLGSTSCRPVSENCFALSFACPPELQHRRELSAFRFAPFGTTKRFLG
jgi:hypothetical protein